MIMYACTYEYVCHGVCAQPLPTLLLRQVLEKDLAPNRQTWEHLQHRTNLVDHNVGTTRGGGMPARARGALRQHSPITDYVVYLHYKS